MRHIGTLAPSLFRREGAAWTIAFDGQVCQVPDARGLHYLARLLRQPGVGVPSDELVAEFGVRRRDPVRPGAGDQRERARLLVTKNIRAALRKIAEVHPSLARHLEATVRRGYVCRYVPDPRVPLRWEA